MAEIVVSALERERIESIALELNGAIDEFFSDMRPELKNEEWDLLTRYTRSCIRRALEVGVLLHAVVDVQEDCGFAYPGRGREPFVRAGLAAWKDSFAPLVDVWRLCPIFDRVPGGEKRVIADVAALEIMAANRMFSSLDEQYSEFFADS
jgi:hypothetical protein